MTTARRAPRMNQRLRATARPAAGAGAISAGGAKTVAMQVVGLLQIRCMKPIHALNLLTRSGVRLRGRRMNDVDAKNTVARLGDIAAVSAGFPFRGAVIAAREGNALVVQMKNVDAEQGVDWASVPRTNLPGKKEPDWLREGDILFAARGSKNYAALIVSPPERAVCSPHFFVIRIRNDAATLPAFVAWLINQTPARKYFEQSATGSYILNIRRQVLESLELVIPPRAQQEIIVALHQAVHSEQKILERLIANRKSQMEAIALGLQGTLGD